MKNQSRNSKRSLWLKGQNGIDRKRLLSCWARDTLGGARRGPVWGRTEPILTPAAPTRVRVRPCLASPGTHAGGVQRVGRPPDTTGGASRTLGSQPPTSRQGLGSQDRQRPSVSHGESETGAIPTRMQVPVSRRRTLAGSPGDSPPRQPWNLGLRPSVSHSLRPFVTPPGLPACQPCRGTTGHSTRVRGWTRT